MSRESKNSFWNYSCLGIPMCIHGMQVYKFPYFQKQNWGKKKPSLYILKQNCYTPISLKCSLSFSFENQLYGNISNSFLFKVHSQCAFETLRALTEVTTM